jgi:hypothetical protein
MGHRGKELEIQVKKADFMKSSEEQLGVRVKVSRGVICVKA